jgi:hypothetical protein
VNNRLAGTSTGTVYSLFIPNSLTGFPLIRSDFGCSKLLLLTLYYGLRRGQLIRQKRHSPDNTPRWTIRLLDSERAPSTPGNPTGSGRLRRHKHTICERMLVPAKTTAPQCKVFWSPRFRGRDRLFSLQRKSNLPAEESSPGHSRESATTIERGFVEASTTSGTGRVKGNAGWLADRERFQNYEL